jgi:hypothetical protein
MPVKPRTAPRRKCQPAPAADPIADLIEHSRAIGTDELTIAWMSALFGAPYAPPAEPTEAAEPACSEQT